MRRVLKWVGIIVGVLLLIIIAAAAILYLRGNSQINKEYDITVAALTIPTGDEEALTRGQHISEAISLCAECHGDDYSGKEFMDSPVFGAGDAPNITPGGIVADYTAEDWIRAIRHGVKPDGTSVKFMPSQHYYEMSDTDLAALIAYLQSVPPVDSDAEELSLGPVAVILVGSGMLELPAEQIDHDGERPVAPEPGVTAEYGDYLVTIGGCMDCHGEALDGDVPPGAPAGPALTGLDWSEQDFINTMRQGINPDGDTLDPEEMPWDSYTRMTGEELQAMWAYIETLN